MFVAFLMLCQYIYLVFKEIVVKWFIRCVFRNHSFPGQSQLLSMMLNDRTIHEQLWSHLMQLLHLLLLMAISDEAWYVKEKKLISM